MFALQFKPRRALELFLVLDSFVDDWVGDFLSIIILTSSAADLAFPLLHHHPSSRELLDKHLL